MTESAFLEYLKTRQDTINKYILKIIPLENAYPDLIHKSMHYSLLAGGKRLRPVFSIAAAEALDGNLETVLPFACAIEMIHTYSLIHDDLPAMDNDDLRRGKPSCHKVFGEALAILAGDALLTHAFLILSNSELGNNISPLTRLMIIKELAEASGSEGMIGGQVLDLEAQNRTIKTDELLSIHKLKTGALIRSSIRVGALIAGAEENDLNALSAYGEYAGLAFQIMDDILDMEAPENIIGKTVKSDIINKKATYPALFGIKLSNQKAKEAADMALSSIESFDHRAEPLRHIASYIITRKK